MRPQQQSNSSVEPEVAAFGKLPWAGDFVQVGHPPGRESFIEWLEQGIAVGAARDPLWKTQFEESGQKGFLFPCDEQTVCAGVLAPSRDAVGRRFPFVVYSSIPRRSLLNAPHIVPLALGSFLHAAGTRALFLQNSEVNTAEILHDLSVPELAGLSGHLEGFQSWAQGESLRNAGQAVFGGAWRERLSYALYVTWEAIRPFMGQEAPPTPLSIRYPLGTGFAGAAVLWLEVVRLCAGWETTIPAAIWSFEPERSCLTVQLGPPSAQTFADVWESEPKNENLINLMDPEFFQADALHGSRPDLADLIEREGTTVDTLLRAIRRASSL
jgi:type VI secretion system protein ImpM